MPKLIMHQRYLHAEARLTHAFEKPGTGRFIFVIGPTGAGKTTLRRAVVRRAVGSPEYWGVGKIPAIEVLAMLPTGAYFSPLAFVESMNRELFVPDLGWLCPAEDSEPSAVRQIREEVTESRRRWEACPRPRASESRSWDALTTTAIERSLICIMVDQASALCTNHKDTKPADHIVHLMTIAEKARINFLMSAVQSAASLWADRTEVRTRSDIIWVPPYSYNRKGDRDPFLQLLRTLGGKYKFQRSTLLFNMAADLLAASAGIFGVLQKILEEASFNAALGGREKITKNDLLDAFYGANDMAKLHKDVAEFENVMKAASTKKEAAIIAEKWNLPKAQGAVKKSSDVSTESHVKSSGESA